MPYGRFKHAYVSLDGKSHFLTITQQCFNKYYLLD